MRRLLTSARIAAGILTALTVAVLLLPTEAAATHLAASYSPSPSNAPTSWTPGQTRSYAVTVTNTGSETWAAAGPARSRLAAQFLLPDSTLVKSQRFSLPRDIRSGESVTLTISVTAPTTGGSYILRHRMVKDGTTPVSWFPQMQNTTVTVGATPTTTATATPTTPPATPTAASTTASQYAARVVELTNLERQKAGLPALAANAHLTKAAQDYAAVLAGGTCFSHSCGSTMVQRVEAAGYTGWRALAENIAAGQATPEAVVATWMASSGHRANILSPNYRELGVGFATGGPYSYYWVQNFGARFGS